MDKPFTLPEGLRRMVVLALEVRKWDDETSRFIRTDTPPRILGEGQDGVQAPQGV